MTSKLAIATSATLSSFLGALMAWIPLIGSLTLLAIANVAAIVSTTLGTAAFYLASRRNTRDGLAWGIAFLLAFLVAAIAVIRFWGRMGWFSQLSILVGVLVVIMMALRIKRYPEASP